MSCQVTTTDRRKWLIMNIKPPYLATVIRTLVNTLSILEWVQEHVEHTCIQNHVGLDLCMVQNQGIWVVGRAN